MRQGLVLVSVLFVVGCVHQAAKRGRRALDEGAYALAVSELRIAVRERPTETDYWLDLGRAYIALGDAPGAIDAFTTARELNPKEARFCVYLGHAHELARRYDLAEVDYRAAVNLAPARAYPHRVLGTRLLRWGRPEEAKAPLARAVELDPDHAETFNAYAMAIAQSGDLSAAEARFREGAARFPEHSGLALGLSVVLLSSSRFEDALRNYEDTARRFPRLAAARVGQALVLAELGRYDEADAALKHAIELDPKAIRYRERLVRSRASVR